MKLNKLLLTSCLVPIAVLPAMVSCNKNKIEIGSDELTYYDEGSYAPQKAHKKEETFFMYKKGKHSFTINQIQDGQPVSYFALFFEGGGRPEKVIFDSWKVLHNNNDVSDNWKQEKNDVLIVKDWEEHKVKSGKLVFEINLIEDTICCPAANDEGD